MEVELFEYATPASGVVLFCVEREAEIKFLLSNSTKFFLEVGMTTQEMEELELLKERVRFYAGRDHPAYGDGCGDYKEYDAERRRDRERLKLLERKALLSKWCGSVAPRAFLFFEELC